MNRLIIIGNGYDKAIGMRTSYSDFIEQLLLKVYKTRVEQGKNYNDRIAVRTLDNPQNEAYLSENATIDNLNDFIKNEQITIKSEILNSTIEDIEKRGWADIEQIYFRKLLSIYQNIRSTNKDKVIKIVHQGHIEQLIALNQDLFEIKKELVIHLQKEESLYHKKHKIFPNLCNKASEKFLHDDFDTSTWNKFDLEGKTPENICILNFNYTDPFRNFNDNILKINIHGYLDNIESIVFGYGDELDQFYQEIETLQEDLFLENFKSFFYIKSPEYNKMLGFLESGECQVYIAGHSCSMSDKTLLNEIFESEYCKNIKVFYYKQKNKEGKIIGDNFNQICYNISRIMSNKPKLRKVVAKKYEGSLFDSIL